LVTYGCGAAMVLTLVVPRATAQLPFPPDLPPAPGSLKNIKPPVPANLGQYIADTNAAIVLGKALDWLAPVVIFTRARITASRTPLTPVYGISWAAA